MTDEEIRSRYHRAVVGVMLTAVGAIDAVDTVQSVEQLRSDKRFVHFRDCMRTLAQCVVDAAAASTERDACQSFESLIQPLPGDHHGSASGT